MDELDAAIQQVTGELAQARHALAALQREGLEARRVVLHRELKEALAFAEAEEARAGDLQARVDSLRRQQQTLAAKLAKFR